MGKNEFIDSSLVKIREKLPATSPASSQPSNADSVVNDKEWRKALFARWDEYKSTRRDVMLRLKSRVSRIPVELSECERALEALRSAEERLKKLFDDLEILDDSKWNRSNFASELASAMKKVENARLECLVVENSLEINSSASTANDMEYGRKNSDFIHELLSISFPQAFKLGMGFFFSLILAVLLAAFLLALFNYLAVC